MKNIKINPPAPPFLNMRVRLRSSGESLAFDLPARWCVSNGLDDLTEVEAFVFPHVVLIFPTTNNRNTSQFKVQLLSTAVIMDAWEMLRHTIEDAQRAARGHK